MNQDIANELAYMDEQTRKASLKYSFSDLVDVARLQKILNSFYLATGIPHGIIDIENNILSSAGWQDICVNFHRICPHTRYNCQLSDNYISNHLQDGSYIGYKCLNGLIDYATPVIIEGQHLATIYLGQLFHQQPDEEFFHRQAIEYGFDERSYMEALCRVPIIQEDRAKLLIEFYSHLSEVLALMGLERMRQLEATNQAIRQREEDSRLVLEASTDGFWDWNIETGKVQLSSNLSEFLGYFRREIELDFIIWKEFIHPGDHADVINILNEHLEGKRAKFEIEHRIFSRTGDYKWIQVRGKVVARNRNDDPLRMVCTCFDITERKQMEKALKESEEKTSKAFNNSPDSIIISTLKEGRYLEVNNAFLHHVGYLRQEVIGHTVAELGIWADPEDRNLMIKQLHENGTVSGFETRLRIKGGDIRTFLISADIIDLDGQPHLLSVCKDISERKRMEEDLVLSEDRFARAFDASPIIMSITTLDEGQFLNVNDSFCRILSFSKEEVQGKTSLEIGFWLNEDDRHRIVQKLIEQGSFRDTEIRFRNKSNEIRIGLYSAEKLEIHGIPCILSLLTDVTEHRQLEIEMLRMDRLNLVGEMAASIGHEIRNPMTSIRGFLQMFSDKYIEDKEFLNIMIGELDRANSIITEYLSLAKNKSVDLAPINLNKILNNLSPLIQANAAIQDKEILMEIEDVPRLLLDEKEIRQLILNFVYNGLEAMAPGGILTIRTVNQEDNVTLFIEDQGKGIAPEILNKLGTPFFTTKDDGTGLGLAVCYGIATRHNARIDIETSPKGTVFMVRFPKVLEPSMHPDSILVCR